MNLLVCHKILLYFIISYLYLILYFVLYFFVYNLNLFLCKNPKLNAKQFFQPGIQIICYQLQLCYRLTITFHI